MDAPGTPYYRRDLALVHHRGFGFHADACAPGILTLLEPVREREGLVVEIGCGSGLLTRYLKPSRSGCTRSSVAAVVWADLRSTRGATAADGRRLP